MSTPSSQTLAQALEPYYTEALSAIPENLRQQAEQCLFVTLLWDKSSADQRRKLIARLEAEQQEPDQHDFELYYLEDEMDASTWWQLSAVQADEAAALLNGCNPLKKARREPHTNTLLPAVSPLEADWHADYQRMLRKFTDVNLQMPENRTLGQWLHVARQAKLKYHAWVDEWIAAGGITSAAVPAPESDESAVSASETNPTCKGITKQQLISAFQGVYFTADQWSKYSASPPKWLLDARTQKGGKSRRTQQTLWNPVLVALSLSEKGIAFSKLDAIFAAHRFLKEWVEPWRESSTDFR